jgi:DUF971 family protein
MICHGIALLQGSGEPAFEWYAALESWGPLLRDSASDGSGYKRHGMTGDDIGAKRVLLTEDSVIIDWSDGQTCRYPARELRLNCGCAECVEEWSQRKLLNPATVPTDIRAEDYLMVGRYAVQFLWSDAHYTGIYPFETIRRLLSCEETSITGGDPVDDK